jgi:hypothetical protein
MSKSGPSQSRKGIGTTPTNSNPDPTQQIPSRKALQTLITNDVTTVNDAASARDHFVKKNWALENEPCSLEKLSRILLTASLTPNIPNGITQVMRAVAYVLDDHDTTEAAKVIANKISRSITDTLTDSLAPTLIETTKSIQQTADFLKAISNDQANITNRYRELTDRQLTQNAPQNADMPPTWAQVASRGTIPTHQSADSIEELKIRQRQALAARRIFVQFDPTKGIPRIADQTPETAMSKLRKLCNDAIEPARNDQVRPIIKNITLVNSGAILLEFNSIEAAQMMRQPEHFNLLLDVLPESATIKDQTFTVILRFVPCKTGFDPNNEQELRQIEEENGLEPNTIASATWVKNPDRRAPNQTVANLKVTCPSGDAANSLIANRIHIHDHIVTAHKDIKEPLRCNKCQQYGHIRVSCQNAERCATCASDQHTTENCNARDQPKCISCGDESRHSSNAKDCPAFLKRQSELHNRNPECRMPYFPTNEKWTWTELPKRTQTPRGPNPPNANQITNHPRRDQNHYEARSNPTIDSNTPPPPNQQQQQQQRGRSRAPTRPPPTTGPSRPASRIDLNQYRYQPNHDRTQQTAQIRPRSKPPTQTTRDPRPRPPTQTPQDPTPSAPSQFIQTTLNELIIASQQSAATDRSTPPNTASQ